MEWFKDIQSIIYGLLENLIIISDDVNSKKIMEYLEYIALKLKTSDDKIDCVYRFTNEKKEIEIMQSYKPHHIEPIMKTAEIIIELIEFLRPDIVLKHNEK